MINIIKLNHAEPYNIFNQYYLKALNSNEKHIEAICVSSFNKYKSIVDGRYVNLKYINDDEWIFFSNYQSPKAIQFQSHDQVAVTILWKSIYVQIRILANIKKTSDDFSNKHFLERPDEKNALAISSNQSNSIDSYDDVVDNYNKTLHNKGLLKNRPDYWGGYSFTPFSFEFWEGNIYRLNKREKYTLSNNNQSWSKNFLQP